MYQNRINTVRKISNTEVGSHIQIKWFEREKEDDFFKRKFWRPDKEVNFRGN